MLNDSRKELSQTKQNLVEFESQKNRITSYKTVEIGGF